MRSINLTDCPLDFRTAYTKHIRAWDGAVQVKKAKDELDGQEDAAAVGGVISSIFGSDSTPWSDHVQAEQAVSKYASIASADIHSTFEDLKDIAANTALKALTSSV